MCLNLKGETEMPPPPGTIKHLVVLMMENRSFDHMFGFLKSSDYPINGLNGNESNLDGNGVEIFVTKDAHFSGDYNPDPGHHFPDVTMQIFGNSTGTGPASMSGFVKAYGALPGCNVSQSHNVMKCFSQEKIPILTTLAQSYAICDAWFSSVPGPTLPNRSFLHAATSMGRLDMNPIWFNEAKTIYELLKESKVSSKIYIHDASVAMTFKNFLQNQKFFGTFDDFQDDCDNDSLPSYSFIEPRYNADDENHFAANDQHPDHDVAEGETLIQDVYNAIRKKKSVWNSTVLVVVYDEHGGLYDHVAPPQGVPNPDGLNSADPVFDFTRLGVRVPAVVISPWVKQKRIDHTQYEHSSIAATARKMFLGASWQTKFLNNRDKTANTFDSLLELDAPRTDVVDFNKPIHAAALARASNPEAIADRATEQSSRELSDLQKATVTQTQFVNLTLPPESQSKIQPHEIQTQGDAAAFHGEVLDAFLGSPDQEVTK
jgi:phospholipase C